MTRNELAKRILQVRKLLGEAESNRAPRAWLLNMLRRIFADDTVHEVAGLSDAELTAFDALRDGPLVLGPPEGEQQRADWDATGARIKDAKIFEVRQWAQSLRDFCERLTLE